MKSFNWLYLVFPIVGIWLTSLFVKYVVKDNISHGITRILYAISRKQNRLKRHNCWSSVIASAITIGFGGSVGAEAPIVLTGSAIGSNLGQLFRFDGKTLMMMLGCGASAAIAGIFKAPIAGLVFTLEVLMIDLTMASLMPILISSVTANGDEAAQQATQHLIDTGSRRIAFIGGPNHLDMVRRRKHGYLEALRTNGIAIDRTMVVCDRIDYDVARQNVTELLTRPDRPDALLTFNDIITFAAFTAIKQSALSIPDDVALIGFTDDEHACYVTPQLSAIEDQSSLMGERACHLLLRQISGDARVCHEIVPQRIVIRQTSAKSGPSPE